MQALPTGAKPPRYPAHHPAPATPHPSHPPCPPHLLTIHMPPPALLIRPSIPADLPAITAIYAHDVLHGTGTFELDAPDVAEMARRRDDVLGKGLQIGRAHV